MTIRAGFQGLGLAVLCAALSGCMAPCVSYRDGSCAPCGLSVRNAGGMPGGYGVGVWETDRCGVGDCGTSGCDAVGYGSTCWNFPLLRLLHNMATCGAGCGRVYWGEWAADPPDGRDPCDDCGNWVGPQCRPAGGCCSLFGLLGGVRFHTTCAASCDVDCVGTTGCDCGMSAAGGEVLDGPWPGTVESIESISAKPVTRGAVPARSAIQRPTTRDPNSRLVRHNRTAVVH